MADDEIYDEPSEVSSRDGTVIVKGPDGVSVILTPEAADETAGRLIDNAAEAAGQRHWVEMERRTKQQD